MTAVARFVNQVHVRPQQRYFFEFCHAKILLFRLFSHIIPHANGPREILKYNFVLFCMISKMQLYQNTHVEFRDYSLAYKTTHIK